MKKNNSILSFALILSLFLSGCIKNEDIVWSDSVVEFDVAAYTTKSGGLPFPLVNRIPTGYGRSLGALDPKRTDGNGIPPSPGGPGTGPFGRTYTTSADTIFMRVNLVGKQRSTPQIFPVKISANFTTAVQGVHFDLIDNQVTIPANSSFGFARWVIRNPGPPTVSGTIVQAVFEISGNNEVRVSENFKYVGWLISQ
ncbi:MAG: DUF4843 domain-containing protein [Chitinophagaceae bacterium]|nr:DUF4843 domain-containing protein [Chitinophagaceae bacterium]